MAINPFRKGGNDTIPISEGGTGAVDAASARANLGAGDLSVAAHATTDHTGIPGVGGNLQLVAVREVDVNAITSFSFTGLDGNADHYYCLVSSIIPVGGGSVFHRIRPNGLTTNQTGEAIQLGTSPSTGPLSEIRIGFTTAVLPCYAVTHIKAAYTGPGSTTGHVRLFNTDLVTGATRVIYTGFWNEGVTNITSLEINANVGNGIGKGSRFVLYKLVF